MVGGGTEPGDGGIPRVAPGGTGAAVVHQASSTSRMLRNVESAGTTRATDVDQCRPTEHQGRGLGQENYQFGGGFVRPVQAIPARWTR